MGSVGHDGALEFTFESFICFLDEIERDGRLSEPWEGTTEIWVRTQEARGWYCPTT